MELNDIKNAIINKYGTQAKGAEALRVNPGALSNALGGVGKLGIAHAMRVVRGLGLPNDAALLLIRDSSVEAFNELVGQR